MGEGKLYYNRNTEEELCARRENAYWREAKCLYIMLAGELYIKRKNAYWREGLCLKRFYLYKMLAREKLYIKRQNTYNAGWRSFTSKDKMHI